jgi:DegV family protein with EDD domain
MQHRTVRVVTDSTCDLSRAEVEKLGAVMVPLSVSFGPEVFYDGQLSSDEYWERAGGAHWPKTSQPSAGAFERAFGAQLDAGYEVVCLTLTGHHSGTHGTALAAAQRLGDKITVVDSRSVSIGMAWQVIAAAEAASKGAERHEIVALVEDMARRTRLYAVLDTIENVRRGGRVSKVMPLLNRMMGMFDLKAVLAMVDGELGLVAALRSYEGALRKVRGETMAFAPLEKIGVIHTRVPEMARAFGDTLADMAGLNREEVRVVEVGPVLACHAGPRVLGAFLLSESLPD